NGISYLKKNALQGRVFPSLAAHNEHLRHWERTVADPRIHGTTRQQVSARFAQEQGSLLPLPASLFPVFHEGRRAVHRDSYIEVQLAYCAGPPAYLQRPAWARWDTREVRVFHARWGRSARRRRREPGEFSAGLGRRGGRGPGGRQIASWRERGEAFGGPWGQW